MILDVWYFIFVGPFMLLGLWASWRVKSAFARNARIPARMSGAQAARLMLDRGGLHSVGIEQVAGHLSDHYDPRAKVLRLSPDVYNGRTMSAVGVACHEAGHALQDAQNYSFLVVRNAAVPIAGFGSNAGVLLFIVGMMSGLAPVAWIGVALFAGVVFFQVVNLPVEFDASNRARKQLVAHGIIAEVEEPYVANVLNAAALTYVAGTLQAIATLAYYASMLLGSRDE